VEALLLRRGGISHSTSVHQPQRLEPGDLGWVNQPGTVCPVQSTNFSMGGMLPGVWGSIPATCTRPPSTHCAVSRTTLSVQMNLFG